MTEDAKYYIGLLGRLLSTRDYEWARDTLMGIATTIERTGEITRKQRAAIDHIMVGRLKHDIGR